MKIKYERELRDEELYELYYAMIFFHILILHPAHSHVRFSYIHNVIVILSRVYNEPIQRPVPTWLVSSIVRALHRYRRGQGFESRTSLIFFQAFFSQQQKLRL